MKATLRGDVTAEILAEIVYPMPAVFEDRQQFKSKANKMLRPRLRPLPAGKDGIPTLDGFEPLNNDLALVAHLPLGCSIS